MKTRGKRPTSSKPAELRGINRNAGTALQATGAEAAGRWAVLLDRDGVINALVYHQDAGVIDSPFTRSQFHLLPRVPETIRLLNDLGLPVVVVSNQPGIAKGHLKPKMLKWFDRTMLSQIRSVGAHIDRIFYCLHHPEAKVLGLRGRCDCRKPETGLLEEAAAQPRLHSFLATSDIHLKYKLRKTREEILNQISWAVGYAKSLCADVEFSRLGGHLKTGQRWSGQNRPTDAVRD